ncbi:hypothetical protein V6N11_054822 [Hibiscus sabdariffa]|uniref:Uncharacterized protein n=1 Tax=Hibiscus sabdariffa TaxID=183260 RepID=A0ABR2NDY5_9ROSI
MITSSVESCLTFKQTPTSKLQYGNWIRYVPPRKQEANPRAKGIIRYLHGKGRSNPKTSGNEKPLNIANPSAETPVPNLVVDADSTNAPTKPVDIITTAPFTHVMLDITAPKMIILPSICQKVLGQLALLHHLLLLLIHGGEFDAHCQCPIVTTGAPLSTHITNAPNGKHGTITISMFLFPRWTSPRLLSNLV